MKFFAAKQSGPPTTRSGVALMTAAALLTPIPDALAKILGGEYGVPVAEIALARFIFQTLTVLPLLLAFGGWVALRVRNPGLNLLRGVLLAVASLAFFAALKAMPLADAIAVFFVQPMIVMLLSVVFLREAPDLRRVLTVLAGFGGALLVIRPNFVALGLVATLPLICALLFAIYLVLGRHLSAVNSSLGMHFYTGLGGMVSLGVFLAIGALMDITDFHLTTPVGSSVWTLLMVMSLFASLIHLMYIQAYRLAPAGLLAPFSYFEIVSAAGLGLLLFADFPDPLKGLGMAIIIGSGLTLGWADRAMAQEKSSIRTAT